VLPSAANVTKRDAGEMDMGSSRKNQISANTNKENSSGEGKESSSTISNENRVTANVQSSSTAGKISSATDKEISSTNGNSTTRKNNSANGKETISATGNNNSTTDKESRSATNNEDKSRESVKVLKDRLVPPPKPTTGGSQAIPQSLYNVPHPPLTPKKSEEMTRKGSTSVSRLVPKSGGLSSRALNPSGKLSSRALKTPFTIEVVSSSVLDNPIPSKPIPPITDSSPRPLSVVTNPYLIRRRTTPHLPLAPETLSFSQSVPTLPGLTESHGGDESTKELHREDVAEKLNVSVTDDVGGSKKLRAEISGRKKLAKNSELKDLHSDAKTNYEDVAEKVSITKVVVLEQPGIEDTELVSERRGGGVQDVDTVNESSLLGFPSISSGRVTGKEGGGGVLPEGVTGKQGGGLGLPEGVTSKQQGGGGGVTLQSMNHKEVRAVSGLLNRIVCRANRLNDGYSLNGAGGMDVAPEASPRDEQVTEGMLRFNFYNYIIFNVTSKEKE